MLRILLRLRDKLVDTVHQVSSPQMFISYQTAIKINHVQIFLLTDRPAKIKKSEVSTQPNPEQNFSTYLESACIGTASFTFSASDCPELCAGACSFFPPDLAAHAIPPTLKRVAKVRYSFLMARPNMMLERSTSLVVR